RLYVPRASGSVASYFSAGGRTTAAKNCIVLPIITPVRKPEKWFICHEQCDGIPSTEEGETTELQAAHLHPLRSGKAYFCASLPSVRTRRNTRDQPATPGNHLQHINQNLRTQNRL